MKNLWRKHWKLLKTMKQIYEAIVRGKFLMRHLYAVNTSIIRQIEN
jgi:hypothetical protein